MKIIAVSDLHGQLPDIPKCDLLLIAGDICPLTNHTYSHQRNWLTNTFRKWLEQQPATDIVGVAGNHDFIFDGRPSDMASYMCGRRRDVPLDLPWHYLQDEAIEIQGKQIFGFPWQLRYGGWAFNTHDNHIGEILTGMQPTTDIVVAHGPPYGFGDLPLHEGRPKGSTMFRHALSKVQPRLTVFGHIHEGRGRFNLPETDCILANVSVLNRDYDMVHKPMEFEIERW